MHGCCIVLHQPNESQVSLEISSSLVYADIFLYHFNGVGDLSLLLRVD